MVETIKIRKGFDINLTGKAEKKIVELDSPETYALKPTDFLGIKRPKLLVTEGENVKAGTPLLFCKTDERINYVSPVSGEIAEIIRGKKRKLLEIRILADKTIEHVKYDKYSISDIKNLSRDEVTARMCKAGVWPHIIQRPYGVVANPDDTPRDIFISGFDSSPLAPDFDILLQGKEPYIQAGIEIIRKFTSGQIHLTINAEAEVSQLFSQLKGISLHKISGPHPAGNVGTQIHQIDPINKGDIVWTTTPIALAQIGKLFLDGINDSSRIIALTGSEVIKPQYYKVIAGAGLQKLLKNNLKSENVRIISGNVLTGDKVEMNSYLGFYHYQVTVIPEGDQSEFLGWIKPTANWLSFHKAVGLLSFINPKSKEYNLSTNTRGDKRAFVLTGVFEKVMPMDIYPTYLFKAILAEDFDDMEALGIYEVIEEDVALCEFVDVSKHNLQQILREGLELLQNS